MRARLLVTALVSGVTVLVGPLVPAVGVSDYVRDVGANPDFFQQVVDDDYRETIRPDSFDLDFIEVRWKKTDKKNITFRYATKGLIDIGTYTLGSSAQIMLDVNLDGIEDHWVPVSSDIWLSMLENQTVYANVYSTSGKVVCKATQRMYSLTFRHVDTIIPLSCLNFKNQVGFRVRTDFGYGSGGLDQIPNFEGATPKFAVFDTPLAPRKTTFLASGMKITLDVPSTVLAAPWTPFKITVTNLENKPLEGVEVNLSSNATLFPPMAVTNKNGIFEGKMKPLFDSNIYLKAWYGKNLVEKNIKAVNYVTSVTGYESPQNGTLVCFTGDFDYEIVSAAGITGVRWTIERNKSGKWEKKVFDMAIPGPDEAGSVKEHTEFGYFAVVKLEGSNPVLAFEANGAKAGETFKCSVSLLVGTVENLPESTQVTATVDGKFTPPKVSSQATVSPKKYANCSALNKAYPGGIAQSSSRKNKGVAIKLKPTINKKVYDLNRTLDKDKDGIACER